MPDKAVSAARHYRLRKLSNFDAEFESLKADYNYYQGYGDLQRLLWKKFDLEPLSAIADREDRKATY